MEIPKLTSEIEMREYTNTYEYESGVILSITYCRNWVGVYFPYWVQLVIPVPDYRHAIMKKVTIDIADYEEFYPEVTTRGWEVIWRELCRIQNE